MQGVISLELLTVLVVGPLACFVCYDIARKNPRANIVMTIIATAEIYGGMRPWNIKATYCYQELTAMFRLGFMTFCPEWLTGNQFLDTSNWMYKWVYLVFFNGLWVVIPLYALYGQYILLPPYT